MYAERGRRPKGTVRVAPARRAERPRGAGGVGGVKRPPDSLGRASRGRQRARRAAAAAAAAAAPARRPGAGAAPQGRSLPRAGACPGPPVRNRRGMASGSSRLGGSSQAVSVLFKEARSI